jgi:hypothetical protein
VSTAGTTTIDYWAVIPSTQQVLHATRDVVIQSAANDNTTIAPTDAATTPAANDNLTLPILMATGTE